MLHVCFLPCKHACLHILQEHIDSGTVQYIWWGPPDYVTINGTRKE